MLSLRRSNFLMSWLIVAMRTQFSRLDFFYLYLARDPAPRRVHGASDGSRRYRAEEPPSPAWFAALQPGLGGMPLLAISCNATPSCSAKVALYCSIFVVDATKLVTRHQP
jgi:hypothetical protein